MRVSLFIAWRYLFSKNSGSAINIISWISVLSIAIATFALVTVLSAFNGLQHLVESMYHQFEPDVKISPVTGKFLEIGDDTMERIRNIPDVNNVFKTMEELTLLRYNKQQSPCTIKGVEPGFVKSTNLDSNIIRGAARLYEADVPAAIVGYGLANTLGLYLENLSENIRIYVPRLQSGINIDPSQAFHTRSIHASGIYLINPDIDNKYLIVPLEFAQDLLSQKGKISSIEVKTTSGKEEEVKHAIRSLVRGKAQVRTRQELNPIIYKTNQSEKMVTFFILVFILIVSTFNVITTLTMILLQKKGDVVTMNYLGFEKGTVRGIFFAEGMLINGYGALIGIVAGIALCLLQQEFGLIRLEGGIVDYYPVRMKLSDFGLILSVILIVGFISSYLPSRLLISGGYQEATLKDV